MPASRIVGILLGVLLVPSPARAQEEVIYYHTDAIGSVRAVTDSSGALVARWDYLPFQLGAKGVIGLLQSLKLEVRQLGFSELRITGNGCPAPIPAGKSFC